MRFQGVEVSIGLLDDLGLTPDRRWLRDPWFYGAVGAALVIVTGLRAVLGEPADTPARGVAMALSFVVWQPLVEELLFRGLIQGRLRKTRWGQWQGLGISGANLAASVLFALLHGVHHPAIWAIAVLAPSLVFGLMRDRHGSVYPGLVLHCLYNGLYLLVGLP